MTDKRKDAARDALTEALQQTPDCLPADRFDHPLSSDEQRHLERCGRCQAELALWREFQESAPSPAEGAAVEWIVAELRRRRDRTPKRSRTRWFPSRWQTIGLSAAAVLTLAVGYLVSNREPGVHAPRANVDVYRSEQIRTISPIGDLASAPEEIAWIPVNGAVRYDIEVLEVDRTSLWRSSSTSPRLELPPEVVARFVPGKTILWLLRALDRDGRTLAQSGDQRFRVTVKVRQ